MAQRTVMIVVLASLVAVSAWAQALTEPAGPGPKPAMIVAGRALTPAAFAESLRGDTCLLYTSPSPRDLSTSRMPSSA